jgi:hypothetical protein
LALRRQVWSGNSCFDPDVTGTGSQPYNFDDWAVQYNRYRVYACTIKCTVETNTSASITKDWQMAVCPSNASTSIVPADMISGPGGRMVNINGGSAAAFGNFQKVECSAKTADVLGQNPEHADRLQAQISTSPSDRWYWHVVLFATDASDTTFAGTLTTELFYDVEFYDRNSLTLDVLERKVRLAQVRLEEAKKSLSVESKDEAQPVSAGVERLLPAGSEQRFVVLRETRPGTIKSTR